MKNPLLSESINKLAVLYNGPENKDFKRVLAKAKKQVKTTFSQTESTDILRVLDDKRRKEVLIAESNSELKLSEITPDKFEAIKQVYWGGASKVVLGCRSISELVYVTDNNGHRINRLNIPERMVHETKPGQLAEAVSNDFRLIFKNLGLGGNKPKIIELNTGLGSLTYSLLRTGFNLLASIERNPQISKYREIIWKNLDLNPANTQFITDEALSYMNKRLGHQSNLQNISIDGIIADPPWSAYITNGGPYTFDVLQKPNGNKIIESMLKHAPVAAIMLPGSFRLKAIENLSNQLGVNYRHYIYNMLLGERKISEAMTVFIRSDANNDVVSSVINRDIRYL